MGYGSKCLLLFFATLLWVEIVKGSRVSLTEEQGVKTAVFLSPKFELNTGSVADKYYHDVDFPRGHIAVKSFNAEIVDENGVSIPLHETYIHHWIALRYYQREGIQVPKYHGNLGFQQSDFIVARNKGLCDHTLSQYFGLGSETRKTATHVPDPYGIEVGNPAYIPAGYEEKWLLNIHAIDTRDVVDKLSCSECLCGLYNVTIDKYGKALERGYVGGLRCCYDETRCKVKEGLQGVKRGLHLKYTVKYLDWNAAIVPVEIYILDVTDRWTRSHDSTGHRSGHDCKVEYEVESCSDGEAKDGCSDTKSVRLMFPDGGDVIYGVAHQHTGGIGSTLYGEDGRVICSSNPFYGNGVEPGNEAGYIVGMSTCYPQPGTVKISKGETLTLVSNYDSKRRHTGVMGLFYLLVARSDSSPSLSLLHEPVGIHKKMLAAPYVGGIALMGVAALVAMVVRQRRNHQGDSYEPIRM